MVDINYLKRRVKPKNYLRKISAISSAALIASFSAFGTFSTYNFPTSFLDEDGNFDADIVVGSKARVDESIAEFLIEELRGDATKVDTDEKLVRITYRDEDVSDDVLDAVKRNSQLNYGETLEEVSESGGFDDSDTNFLDIENFDNGISDEDYEQKLKMLNGEFNYAFRNDIDDLDEITSGIYYDNGDEFAQYIIEFNTAIDLDDTNDLDEDMVGEILTIMDNDFTIVNIRSDGSDLDEITLVGGREDITIEEGETKTVNVEGTSYEIGVNIVSENKVSLIVDGTTRSLDLYEAEEFDGISIAVTDLVDSSRDSVKGVAQLVIGGQKITLYDGGKSVQINDDDIEDIYEEYDITSDFSDGNLGMETITITYRVEDETLLEDGDYLEDVLFNAFEIKYRGIESKPDYVELDLDVSNEVIEIRGILIDNEELDREFIYTTTTNGVDGETYIQGERDDDRLFFKGADLDQYLPNGFTKINANVIEINFSENDIEGSGFLMREDNEDQYWYEINGIDISDKEIDFEEIFESNQIDEVKPSDFESEIDISLSNDVANDNLGTLQLDLNEFGDATLAFDNELIMDLSNVEGSGVGGFLRFSLDTSDVDGDDLSDVSEVIDITFGWDLSDDEFNLLVDSNDVDFVNANNAEEDDDSDTYQYVTAYGTIVEVDTDEDNSVVIRVPDEQVSAEVDIIFGSSSSGVGRDKSVIVSEDKVDSKREELEDRGFKIIDVEDVSKVSYDIDIDEIMLDTEINNLRNKIIIGGPAINEAAAEILGVDFPTYGPDSELEIDESVIRYYDEFDSLLIYGYNGDDTRMAVEELVKGELGDSEIYLSK